jgi:predicted phosphodiesterase
MNRFAKGIEPLCPVCKTNKIRTVGALVCYKCKRVSNLATAHGMSVEDMIAKLQKDGGEPEEKLAHAWQDWARTVGSLNRYYKPMLAPLARKKRTKILVIPDLHVPFHHREALYLMLKREADTDLAIVMGDIGDAFSLSRFIKYEDVPYQQEITELQQVCELLSSSFPAVKLIAGNHDGARLEKMLRATLNQDFMAAVLFLTEGRLSPVDAIAAKYPNIELAGHRVSRHNVRWFTQVGDAIFTHAESFSRVPGSALRRIEEWVTDMERTLELDPWRVLVQAHTHQLGMIPWSSDKLLVECGCLCQTHGYQLSPRIAGRPQRLGYVTLEQEGGKTDINSVRCHWLDDMVSLHEARETAVGSPTRVG